MDGTSIQILAAWRGARLLPRALTRPALLLQWLAQARGAQLFALVFAAFVWAGLPALSEALLHRYPPIVTETRGFLGLFERREERPDPRLATRRRQLEVVTWTAGATGIVVLLLAALPAVVAHGDAKRASPSPAPSRAPDVPAAPAAPSAPQASEGARTLFAPLGNAQSPGEPLAGRYALLGEIGRGGMGVVYRARDLMLEREVALKELPFHLGERPELARRFRQEAQLLARLSHPHIVHVYDLFEADSRLWMALELIGGGTLVDEMTRAGGVLPLPRALAFARQISQGLAYAHANGVMHRDVKPLNVLLTRDPDPLAKLTDFGIARLLDATAHTQVGTLLGSARYMSPELAAGAQGDARSDAYALGVTIYELVTGRAPFEGELRSVLARQISEVPRPLCDIDAAVPRALDALVASLLAKDPADRPLSLALVTEALVDLEREVAAA
jgi:hypothetical protein